MKRYFYYKKDNVKINRQVIWLVSNENWCFLDYRYNFKGKIKLSEIELPDFFDFRGLLVASNAISNMGSMSSSKRKQKHNTVEGVDDDDVEEIEGEIKQEVDEKAPFALATVTSISSEIPSSITTSSDDSESSSSDLINLDLVKLEEQFISPFEDDVSSELLQEDTSTFPLDNHFGSGSALTLLEFEPPTSPKQEEGDEEFSFFPKRRRTESSSGMGFFSSSSLIPAAPMSLTAWEWTSPSSIFSSGLEYFFDMVSHLICNQLMFQRRFFRKYGIDSDMALEKVKQVCVNFDLREFPGNIIKTFFESISENYFHTNGDQLPTIYCIVCGQDIKSHDEKAHREFFGQLDQGFVVCLQEKARNMYELVKQYIIYLLKNPNSHEKLKAYLTENLHCPFCSGKHGCHHPHKHKQWTTIWKLDPFVSATAPPPLTNNVYDYTKSTFEWLVDQVPFYIPPFLLSLHYAKYVRTFMECLVACWNTVRLGPI